MSLERRVSFPEKPELVSPYFSYKVLNPTKIGEVLRLLNKENEFFSVQIGEQAHGFIDPLTIHTWNYGFIARSLTLGARFSLPIEEDFMENPGLIYFRNAKAKRGHNVQRQLRRYIDKDLNLGDGGLYPMSQIRKKGGKLIGEFPDGHRVDFSYYMPGVIPNNNSPESALFLKMYLEDALKTLIIFATELYRYKGINADSRELVIDPSLFRLTYERKRPMSLEEIKELEKRGPEIIARAVLGVDKPAGKDVPNKDNDKTRLEEDVDKRRN